jgi:membrane associated rhomboid family serine protease
MAHLVGNLLALIVFGSRVNELIGTTRMVICYVLLALAAALSQMYMTRHEILYPMLGASGAVMGMAGMYFVFFPLQKLRMAIWARWFLIFPPLIVWTWIKVSYKLFMMRGFWLLLLVVLLQDVLPVAFGSSDDVAHWAHLGGFVTGVVLALLILLTRQVNSRGSDVLSVALGRHAWPLVGRPGRWQADTNEAAAPAAGFEVRT